MSNISVVFYTEAGTKAGMGHLIRSYTLYREFKSQNIKSDFFLDSDINFSYKFNDINYFRWDSINISKKYDIVFIDSYIASLDTYNYLYEHSSLLVCIDDYNRLNYPQGVILNFAPDSKELFFKEKEKKYTYLLGLDYIPIRDEFLNLEIKKKNQIFIMLGGMDVENLSTSIIQEIQQVDIPKVIVVNNKNIIDELEKYKDVKVLCKPTDKELVENMANSIMAISTASMSLYELSYLKIPTIVIALNKNQQIGIAQSIRHNIATYQLNLANEYWQKELLKYINLINKNSLNTTSKIDGMGTKRVLNKIMKLVRK